MAERQDSTPAEAPAGEHRLIAAGSGGQGVLTFCKLLCTAAVAEGRSVTYLPSYGPEVRSGTARCRVVISPAQIYSPLVERPDSLVILNQMSFDRFAEVIKPGGLMVLNASLIDEQEGAEADARVLCLPATQMAVEMGEIRVANVIMLGAYVRAAGLVGEDACRRALRELMGGRKAELLALNQQALKRGMALAEAAG